MADLFEPEQQARLKAENRGGHIVELKTPTELYTNPEHPYTRKLLAAIPSSDPADIKARFRNADPHLAL